MNQEAGGQERESVLAALRRTKGRVTVGDVAAASGLPNRTIREALHDLLESHRGHLEVSQSGELVYDFDPALIERDAVPWRLRLRRRMTHVASAAFKGWIVVMLVGYFVLFVVLVVAALVAGQRGNSSRGGWGGGRHSHRGGGGLVFDPLMWYWLWSPRWRLGRPYYGRRWERTLDEGDRVPFYKKVFAFVFGPDRPEPTRQQLDRAKLRLIRANDGVLSTAELVAHAGTTFGDAEEELARLMGTYDGEPAVSPEGELVYVFPSVMASASGRRRVRPPNSAWLRLEHPRELTGNSAGANAVIAGMNAFTLAAAATAPWFIFPRLGIGGAAALLGLVAVPVVYSVLFFALPALRMLGVRRDNRRRERRNVYRVLLGHVFEESLARRTVHVDEAREHVASRLGVRPGDVEARVREELEALARDLEADVVPGEDGSPRYDFAAIRDQFGASETVRSKMRLDDRSLGDVVYSTRDTQDEAHDRDLALFDRALSEREAGLVALAHDTDRIDFEEEYELVAFDEELGR